MMEVLAPDKLLQRCQDMYTSFNSATTTPDAHADEKLLAWKILNSDDCTFIRQVFYGLYRYKKLINVLITAFFHSKSGEVQRSDVNMYMVFTYVSLLRLRELTFYPYRRLILCQEPQKMVVFLSFVFNEENLNNLCKDEWLKLYDVEFVEQLVADVLVWLPDIDELISHLEEKVYLNKKKEEEEANAWAAGGKGRATVARPFNITAPKPRVVPPEEPPQPPIKAKAPPPRKTGPTTEEIAIQQVKEQNREKMNAFYSDPKKQPFKLASDQRPTNIEKVREEVEAERAAELQFDGIAPRPAPAPTNAQVKLNSAAILREDALYKKKQEQEAKILQQYEQELRDASEFKEWQSTMLAMDEKERLEEVERRRIEMAASQQAAIEAKLKQVEENKELVAAMRIEAAEAEEQLAAERAAQEDVNRQKREKIVDDRQGIKVAQEKVTLEKKVRADALTAEKAELARRMAEERALEHQRKQDLIRQLRAMENVPMAPTKEFDPTSTMEIGLLEEMSLAELKERMAVVKRKQKEAEEEKRNEIVDRKQQRENMLMEKAANISRIRDLGNTQAQMRRLKKEQAKEEVIAQQKVKREQGMLDLHERLQNKQEARKAEQARLAAEEKAIKFEQLRQAASASAVEETKFKELRKGQDRDLKVRQDRTQVLAAQYEKTKHKQEAIRKTNIRNESKAKRDFIKDYDERIKQLTAAKEVAKKEEIEYKTSLVEEEHARVETMHAKGLHISQRAVI